MKNDERAELGRRIREAREYRGFSQEDVAAVLGISRSAVSLVESGGRRLDVLEIGKLAKLFGCSIDELTAEPDKRTDASIQMLARAAATLSAEDREEVVRFAQFLGSKRQR